MLAKSSNHIPLKLFLLVDLIEVCAVGEMYLVGVLPSAKNLIDGEELHLSEVLRILFAGLHQPRSIVVLGRYFLAFGGIEIFQVGLGYRAAFRA